MPCFHFCLFKRCLQMQKTGFSFMLDNQRKIFVNFGKTINLDAMVKENLLYYFGTIFTLLFP